MNFGDVFLKEGTDEYYMCITALCDCLHPSNVKNNFFFVKGKLAVNLSDAIKTGDSGFKSFLDKEKCVLWTSGEYIKPVQLHISQTEINNNILNTSFILNAVLTQLPLKYVFSLKSSYAQRIANHTFAHPIRVGVDFVNK
ncbi:hypothetical protein D3C85_1254980 [compost metagenome]